MASNNKLKLSHELSDFLRNLPPAIKSKVRYGLDALLANPHEGKPLRAELAGLWSLRVGRFRIIYRIQPDAIEIVAVGPRSSIYPEVLERLARLQRF